MSIRALPADGETDRARSHLGGLVTIRAAAEDTNGSLAVVEERAGRGYTTPPHVHRREDETLFVIEGTLEYTVDGVTATATGGSAVFLPRGLPHTFSVISEQAHFLVIITPGGFEQFFSEVSPAASASDRPPTDPMRMVASAAALGTTVFRPEPALAAARIVATSTTMPEIVDAYRAIEDVVAGTGPLPSPLGALVDPLVTVATTRLSEDPVHARSLILLGILIERAGPDLRSRVPERAVQPDWPEATALAAAYLWAHFTDREPALLADLGARAEHAIERDPDVTPDDGDEYFRTRLSSVPGPVLDLGQAPEVSPLPFATGSLGAVHSNALHLLPEPRAVVREIGRCLRPGGIFTAVTVRRADRPAHRYFQRRRGRAFEITELVTWLGSAGLELVDLRTRADTVLFTARTAGR